MERPTEKVIAYSVYGTSKLYLQGAIDCLKYNERFAPNWRTEFYVANNCPVLETLLNEEIKGRCQVNIMGRSECVEGSTVNSAQHHNEAHLSMLYRISSLFVPNRIVKLSDTDSRSSPREFDALEEWLETDYPVCAMYDNPAHIANIVMPGLTAWDTRIISQIYSNYEDYRAKEKRYRQWYSTEGYKQGLRFVHYDIWHLKHLFIDQIGNDRVMNIKEFKTPMPSDESCGEHLGATVNDQEWRYINWELDSRAQ